MCMYPMAAPHLDLPFALLVLSMLRTWFRCVALRMAAMQPGCIAQWRSAGGHAGGAGGRDGLGEDAGMAAPRLGLRLTSAP
jgi:hypothetical protein